ncbi:MAG TPA: hypothetical protein VID04_18100 [Methylomirabilota bacterium]
MIEGIDRSPDASIVVVARNLAAQQGRPRGPALYRMYERIEDAFFPLDGDAFEPVSIADLLTGCPLVDIAPRGRGPFDEFDEAVCDRLSSFQLDVILKFGFRSLRGRARRLARYGIWECVQGSDSRRQTAPGFWEVFREEPCTTAVLNVLGSGDDEVRTIDHCHGYTDKHSVRRNRHYNAWRASRFPLRCLERLEANRGEARPGAAVDGVPSVDGGGGADLPGNRAMTFLLAGHLWRYVKKKIYDALYRSQWAVGFKLGTDTNSLFSVPRDFTIIEPPPDRFWADPFVVRAKDSYFIFLEELLHATNRGHLSVVEVDGRGRPGPMTRILEKAYHLSYPFVFEHAGQIYMLPETSGNGTIEVYRATRFPYQWERHAVLMEGLTAVDTTLVEIDGRWWMFTTTGVKDAPLEEELHVFYASSPFGPWRPHQRNPVISDCRRGRQAGRIFQHRGSFYRPAQESTRSRGYGLSINRITRLTPDDYGEEPVLRIRPGGRIRGIHTLNHASGMTVIDLNLKTRRPLYRGRPLKSITPGTSSQPGILYTPDAASPC